MRIDVVSVFPEMVRDALSHSIVKRAVERRLVTINVVNLRDYTRDRHRTTDDVPFGGGGGMVMKIEPITRALVQLTAGAPGHAEAETLVRGNQPSSPPGEGQEVRFDAEADPTGQGDCRADEPTTDQICELAARRALRRPRIVLTDPRGVRFDQAMAREWASESHLVILCGHYEGVDDRVRQHLVTDEVSIGDYVLTGGELPALVIVDAVTRLQSGALGDCAATENDSYAENLLEYPHYTRPSSYLGWKAPDILLSGHHAEIQRWRRWHQLRETHAKRPDLFSRVRLSPQDENLFHGPEPTAPVNEKPDRRTTDQSV